MGRESAFIIVLLIILTASLSSAIEVQSVKASGTIYIRADGSIDPPTAPISTVDGVTYTLTGNISSDADGIDVERDNIVLDGSSFTIDGTTEAIWSYFGVRVYERYNVTIQNANVRNFFVGICLYSSSNNKIKGNSITNNTDFGVFLNYFSNGNSIDGNNITDNNNYAIGLDSSSNNSISGNTLINNIKGIWLWEASNNTFHHDNLIDNSQQVSFGESGFANVWDDDFPSGGNYWSDYNGTDENHDGIGDAPYVIDADNTDHYPLMTQYIIPEFPSFLILPLFFTLTLLAVIAYRRRHFYHAER